MEFQLSLLERPEIEAAIATVAEAEAEFRGAVFTRREVVDLILDLAGYTSDEPLHDARILEPSMGRGDFLLPVIERLFEAYERRHSDWGNDDAVDLLGDCIVGVEVHRATFEKTQASVIEKLQGKGLNGKQAKVLCKRWLRQGDFLLLPLDQKFTHVVGNPPYIRQEMIPDVLMAEYRRRYRTIFDRADIYVPFIEQSLSLLAPSGNVAFICADRWIKNRYGGPLRRMIAEKYHLKYFVDMVDTEAFHSDVIAYPAIIVIGQEKPSATRVSRRSHSDCCTGF
jgi:type I restriction-modification system DNA methylase subunit